MTRMEELLTALINGEAVSIEPRSRMEQYLKNCCDRCGCDNLPEPISRAEVLLHQLAEELANGGGGTNSPLAYTVSSVDELPSDAVDGSTAIVSVTSKGTIFTFNDEIADMSVIAANTKLEMTFTYDGIEEGFKGYEISRISTGPNVASLSYSAINTNTVQLTSKVAYMAPNSYGLPSGWQSDAYKTIYISKYPIIEDGNISGANLLDIFESSGSKTGEFDVITNALYTRENGEWVYKCEVA